MCNSCQVLNINGCNCHEIGCPEAWKDYKRECEFCGFEFLPEDRYQIVCSEECAEAYYN